MHTFVPDGVLVNAIMKDSKILALLHFISELFIADSWRVSYFIYLTFLKLNLRGKNLGEMTLWRDVMSPSKEPACDVNIMT